jgi:hypothetical protein
MSANRKEKPIECGTMPEPVHLKYQHINIHTPHTNTCGNEGNRAEGRKNGGERLEHVESKGV